MKKENEKHKTGIEDYFIIKNNKKMQFGYTTGTCAAAATKAAAMMLLGGERIPYVLLKTPKGIELNLEVLDIEMGEDFVKCAIMKDAGDDPDVTHGLKIYASVSKIKQGFSIEGGIGVGRVTAPGLEQPVGEAAINSTPRKMIEEALFVVSKEFSYEGGLVSEISVPLGVETAKQTFNPRLGIVGGISILGTSGIVEPMSERALLRSLEIEIGQQIKKGRKNLVVTLGNYGKAFLDGMENFPLKDSVKCSNYIGEALDMALNQGAESVLFIAHIGKFVKVGGGIMNTHSRNADSRGEIMAACALRAGADRETAMRLLDIQTTDEGVEILEEANLLDDSIAQLMKKIKFYLNHRTYGKLKAEAMIYSNAHGYLGETEGFKDLVERVRQENE